MQRFLQFLRQPERLLTLTGVDPISSLLPKMQLCSSILLFHFVARNISEFRNTGFPFRFYLAAGFLCCFLASLRTRFQTVAITCGFLLSLIQFAYIFPGHPNHFFLEWLALLLIAICCPLHCASKEQLQALCQTLKWIVLLTFFLAALQKVLHGTYYRGVFIAHELANAGRFDGIISMIVSSAEFAHYKSIVSPGPFVLRSIPALILSNLIWLTQIFIPGLLLTKWRAYGLVCTILLLLIIELIAREFMFGLFALLMLLLFIPGNGLRYARAPFLLCYIALIAARFGYLHIAFN